MLPTLKTHSKLIQLVRKFVYYLREKEEAYCRFFQFFPLFDAFPLMPPDDIRPILTARLRLTFFALLPAFESFLGVSDGSGV